MSTNLKESRILSLNNIKPPVEGRCGFFVKRKQRYCKMLPAKGNKFCAEHLSQEDNPHTKRKRIVCPLDKNHTVFEDKLKQHMKKCNVARKIQLPYYTESINLGLKDYIEGDMLPLYEVPLGELKDLISKVKTFYTTIINDVNLKEQIGRHAVIEDELKIPEYGINVKKHLIQQASLVDILDKLNVLHDDMIVLEFGAGRGALSHWIQKAMKGTQNKFLLIDRQHNRNKLDCYHKGENQGPNFERLNIDIQHLNIGRVTALLDNDMKLTGVGKHLCGGATDLSLRCLFESEQNSNSGNDESDEIPSKKQKSECLTSRLHSVLFALCCYHRCTWNTYVGTRVLLQNGFTSKDFLRITKMAGWATCGFKRRNSGDEKNEDNLPTEYLHGEICEKDLKRHEELNQTDKQFFKNGIDIAEKCTEGGNYELAEVMKSKAIIRENYSMPNLTTLDQEEIGRICKRIIDYGRIQYIRNHGFNAELLLYVHNDITPENIALCVTRPSTE